MFWDYGEHIPTSILRFVSKVWAHEDVLSGSDSQKRSKKSNDPNLTVLVYKIRSVFHWGKIRSWINWKICTTRALKFQITRLHSHFSTFITLYHSSVINQRFNSALLRWVLHQKLHFFIRYMWDATKTDQNTFDKSCSIWRWWLTCTSMSRITVKILQKGIANASSCLRASQLVLIRKQIERWSINRLSAKKMNKNEK